QLAVVIGTLLLCFFNTTSGQQQTDGQQKLLEVRRRQIELQAARKQLEKSEKLAAQGLLPQTDVDRDRTTLQNAQLSYQQAVLALFDMQPRISVRSAIKTQTPDGRKFVKLVITNLTPTFDDAQFKLLNNFEGADPIPEQLRTRSINDVFVSLKDSGANGSATISLPYEVHIPEMKYGEEKTLNYQLLRDVDTLVVSLAYRNQSQDIVVQLEHAAGGNEIQTSSSQFSQEADLGSQATYNISLERPSVDVRSFQLKVLNLPRQISYSFIDL